MIFAHFPAGYLISEGISKRVSLPRGAHFALWLGSIAPDFDLVLTLLFPLTSHRLYPTHIPFFYCIVSILCLVAYLYKKNSWKLLSLYFLIGCWLHLILDSPTGLLLLYPISAQRIQLTERQLTFSEYFQSSFFFLEFLIILPFVILVLKKINAKLRA